MLTMIREAARKHTLYRRTRDEIARMPREVALDLNLFPEDAQRIAYEAVYGRKA
ncbi:hypothetical protein [Neotabrizicola sp. VNH66]|uniref:hypothetical protein n=1 Tax=Neotabrizicola sp. VNH66 TaxID=3400918 RepID=UPI003BFB3D23